MGLVSLLRKKHSKLLFTTPSHSQRNFIFKKLTGMYKLDISETETHNPPEALNEAEVEAAKIYGTNKTKFLTNGSTSGIIAATIACTKKNDKILIWENSHICHKNAAKLTGAEIITYEIPKDSEWGVSPAATPEILEPYLKKYDIKTVIVTSPTYEGFTADIKKIKDLCSKYNAYLIVDEAHGALYPFSDKLPESAVRIADFTIQSLHKTAGGLNPTALLHTNTDLDVDSAIEMINTTSPSYPLLASIEQNIKYLNSTKGRKKLATLINHLESLRENCNGIDFGGNDITKLVIKHKNLSGEDLSEILYDKYNIEDEKTNKISTMLLCGIGTTDKKIKALSKALKSIISNY